MSVQLDPTYIYSQFINQVKEYAIFAADNNGIITFWNEGAERIKGYKDEEIIGQYYGMLFTYNYQKKGKPENELREARANGLYKAEDCRKRKDGSLFWAKIILTSITRRMGNKLDLPRLLRI